MSTWRGGATETILVATSLGAPSTQTDYMLTTWLDSTNALVYVQVNSLFINSATHTAGAQDGAAPLLLGAAYTSPGFQIDTGGNLLAGQVAHWTFEEASGTRNDATDLR